MRRLISLLLGILLGAAVGAALVMLFAPTSGDQVLKRLQRGWQETFDEARRASEQRRRELEDDLARMQQKARTPALPR